jgi:hypothetical protein
MAEQVPAVSDVLDAIERRNWERLQRLLHPEVHWTTAVEEQLHGAHEVIARLSNEPAASSHAQEADRAAAILA